MKINIRDAMGVVIGTADVTWVIDPQDNAEFLAAYQEYSFPLIDFHGTVIGQVEMIP